MLLYTNFMESLCCMYGSCQVVNVFTTGLSLFDRKENSALPQRVSEYSMKTQRALCEIYFTCTVVLQMGDVYYDGHYIDCFHSCLQSARNRVNQPFSDFLPWSQVLRLST
jgi:hypothetical protein